MHDNKLRASGHTLKPALGAVGELQIENMYSEYTSLYNTTFLASLGCDSIGQ
jgi:hypothetical protein